MSITLLQVYFNALFARVRLIDQLETATLEWRKEMNNAQEEVLDAQDEVLRARGEQPKPREAIKDTRLIAWTKEQIKDRRMVDNWQKG